MPRKLSSAWKTTAVTAGDLGVTAKFLRETLRMELKEGTHYRNISPGAVRPSYRWHLSKIEKLLDKQEKR